MPRHSPCALSSLTYHFPKREANQVLVLIEYFMDHAGSELDLEIIVLPSIEKFHKKFLVSLCCLLFILLVALFSFQGAA